MIVTEGDIIQIAACPTEYRLSLRPQPQHVAEQPLSSVISSAEVPRQAASAGAPSAAVSEMQ